MHKKNWIRLLSRECLAPWTYLSWRYSGIGFFKRLSPILTFRSQDFHIDWSRAGSWSPVALKNTCEVQTFGSALPWRARIMNKINWYFFFRITLNNGNKFPSSSIDTLPTLVRKDLCFKNPLRRTFSSPWLMINWPSSPLSEDLG